MAPFNASSAARVEEVLPPATRQRRTASTPPASNTSCRASALARADRRSVADPRRWRCRRQGRRGRRRRTMRSRRRQAARRRRGPSVVARRAPSSASRAAKPPRRVLLQRRRRRRRRHLLRRSPSKARPAASRGAVSLLELAGVEARPPLTARRSFVRSWRTFCRQSLFRDLPFCRYFACFFPRTTTGGRRISSEKKEAQKSASHVFCHPPAKFLSSESYRRRFKIFFSVVNAGRFRRPRLCSSQYY